MDCERACEIINRDLVFAPGWVFKAQDATHLHGSTIHVQIAFPAVETAREDARKGYPSPVLGQGGFFVMVDECDSADDVAERVLRTVILPVFEHEAREMLRLRPDHRAPLHPHTVDGRKRWSSVCSDGLFGYPVEMPAGPAREPLT